MDKRELCEKIEHIYPNIGKCGINLDAHFDKDKDAWVVHLEKNGKKLDTYLEEQDIQACLEGKQCIALAIQVEELEKDLEEMSPTRQ